MTVTLPTRRRAVALAGLLLLLAPIPARAQAIKRITTASAVRVRSAPSTSATVVDTLSIGVVLDEMDRSDAPQRVGAQEDYWYRVGLPGGRQGWVFGGLTRAVDGAQVEQAYVDVARERLARDPEAYTFTDWTDLAAFLKRVSGTVRARELAGELELSRLQATAKALLAIPFDKQDQAPYKTWLSAQGDTIVYNELAGQWVVNRDKLWTLQPKYADLPVGEQIAWEAAHTPLLGECEGYLPCHFYAFNVTSGRYLELYPKGKHADEALGELLELMNPTVADIADGGENHSMPEGAEERAELREALSKTRSLVESTPAGSKRDEVLRLLGQIEQAAK